MTLNEVYEIYHHKRKLFKYITSKAPKLNKPLKLGKYKIVKKSTIGPVKYIVFYKKKVLFGANSYEGLVRVLNWRDHMDMTDNKKYRSDIFLKVKNDHDIELTEDQITMCIITEQREGLSFFHGHIYPIPRKVKRGNDYIRKITWEKSIDGYRVLANRNGLSEISKPKFEYKGDKLYSCEISVWKLNPTSKNKSDALGPFIGIAYYDEFVQMVDEFDYSGKRTGKKRPNRQWNDQPLNQLSVCAERQALRKAGLDHSAGKIELHPESPSIEDIDSKVIDDVYSPIIENDEKIIEEEFNSNSSSISQSETSSKENLDKKSSWSPGNHYENIRVVKSKFYEKEKVWILSLINDDQIKLDDNGFFIAKKPGNKASENTRNSEQHLTSSPSPASVSAPEPVPAPHGHHKPAINIHENERDIISKVNSKEYESADVNLVRSWVITLIQAYGREVSHKKSSIREIMKEVGNIEIPDGAKYEKEDYVKLLVKLKNKLS